MAARSSFAEIKPTNRRPANDRDLDVNWWDSTCTRWRGLFYLMLLPRSNQGMLLNEYDHVRFTIFLREHRQLIAVVTMWIGATPVWE